VSDLTDRLRDLAQHHHGMGLREAADELDRQRVTLKMLQDDKAALQACLDAAQRRAGALGERVAGLELSLIDALDFLERHSNRWDGVNGKHPQEVVEAARAALKGEN